MNCPFCFSQHIEIVHTDFPYIRHVDFGIIKSVSTIGHCRECGLVYNNMIDENKIDVEKIYTSEQYATSLRLNQLIYVNGYQKPVTPYFLQAEIICPYIESTSPSILDIGCFDGRLLTVFDDAFIDADLNGFDVNAYVRAHFPYKRNFRFWCGDLSHIKGTFDLITISHSLQYVSDLNKFMETISFLLKPDGAVFFQAPDLSKNPYAFLYGDLYYYFTPSIMKNIFQKYEFDIEWVDHHNWFPREIVLLAKKKKGEMPATVVYQRDDTLETCHAYLKDVVRSLHEIAFTFEEPLGVLGTTLNAAFVNSVIERSVSFFLDENELNVGKRFHDKRVLHPDMLNGHETILIPYGSAGKGICDKFKKKLKNKIVCL